MTFNKSHFDMCSLYVYQRALYNNHYNFSWGAAGGGKDKGTWGSCSSVLPMAPPMGTEHNM